MPKSIVIVESNVDLANIYRVVLERHHYQVFVISSGANMLRNNFIIPDLFLIEHYAGSVDGFKVCSYLKQFARTASIPVVMISAHANIAQLSHDAGANDWIAKPFDANMLLLKIDFNIGARYQVNPNASTRIAAQA